mmetsp:Transcript_18498/g.32102  ORF Transcript_18498/g.32102 Transcript_18498/m.32102 type:complete len:136 (+) Transcript_18498:2545-2952(+)
MLAGGIDRFGDSALGLSSFRGGGGRCTDGRGFVDSDLPCASIVLWADKDSSSSSLGDGDGDDDGGGGKDNSGVDRDFSVLVIESGVSPDRSPNGGGGMLSMLSDEEGKLTSKEMSSSTSRRGGEGVVNEEIGVPG